METLTLIKTLVEIIFLIIAVITCFYLMFGVRKVNASVSSISSDMGDIYNNISPVLANAAEAVKNSRDISENVKKDYEKLSRAISAIYNAGDRAASVIGIYEGKAIGTVKGAWNLARSFSAAVKAFKNKLS